MKEFRCPYCVSQGLSSLTIVATGQTTSLYFSRYIDAQGDSHYHDENVEMVSYACSRGHSGYVQNFHECWCGWVQGAVRR